jgi:hypothetical protein
MAVLLVRGGIFRAVVGAITVIGQFPAATLLFPEEAAHPQRRVDNPC